MSDVTGRRWHHIFGPDRRSVVIAFDHAMTEGLLAGMESPGEALERLVVGGADAILTSVGVARHFSERLRRVGLLIRCDGATSPLLQRPRDMLVDAETLLRIGADAATAMYFPGSDPGTMAAFSALVADAHRWQIPVVAEALPFGFEPGPDKRTVEGIRTACRMAIEAGADIVKTAYTGNVKSFADVIAACYAPVLVLGGPKVESEADCLAMVRAVMDAGAAGVAIGRHAWQSRDPAGMTRALAAIVHEEAGVDQAMTHLAVAR